MQVSGTNLCRALELTACGARPGTPTLPTGKLERGIPELFQRDIQLEIEDLVRGVKVDVLKKVCTERRMQNSSTKIGLAVCIALNKDRRYLYECSDVDVHDRGYGSRSSSVGSGRGLSPRVRTAQPATRSQDRASREREREYWWRSGDGRAHARRYVMQDAVRTPPRGERVTLVRAAAGMPMRLRQRRADPDDPRGGVPALLRVRETPP